MSDGEDPIFFTVIGAKDLEADAELGTYVTVSIGTQMLFRTGSKIGEAPQWNETHPINASGPQSYSIAVHRESPTADPLLGEVTNIIVDSGPQELTFPIKSLTSDKPIMMTIAIRCLEDMLVPSENSNNHPKRLICLSDFIIKSIPARHPDLLDNVRLSVVIIVNGNSMYKMTAAEKDCSKSHWSYGETVIISSGFAYTLEVVRENPPRHQLGFVQLDNNALEGLQEKQVMQMMVQNARDNPPLEILFSAKVLGQDTSDTLLQMWGSATTGMPRLGLSLDCAPSLQEHNTTSLNSNEPSSYSGSTPGREHQTDIPSHCVAFNEGLTNAFSWKALGDQLLDRFKAEGSLPCLKVAIILFHRALLPDGHQDEAVHLWKLGLALTYRFDLLGDLSELNEAVDCLEKSYSLFASGHPEKIINNIGTLCQSQFERLGNISDLDKAISAHENAVHLTPTGHPSKVSYLNDLGISYQAKFKRLGDISDLEKAISSRENAVELTPIGHPDKAMCLNNLGNSYQSQFERLGDISALEKAISAQENAVDLTPIGHPNKPACLSNLGNSYQTKFERLGDISALEKAISAQENAVELTPIGHPDKAMCLNNLGNSYQTKFERLGDISDLEKAISAKENAVELTPIGHPDKAMCLNNLGISYQTKFERLGEISALEKAISAKENAVELTPIGHPDKAMCLNNLGISYQTKFERLGDISDLEKAISAKENAVELTPIGHPDKAMYLNNLGNSYKCHFLRLGETAAINKAIDCFSLASQSLTSPPLMCFSGAIFWVKCAEIAGLSPIEAYDKALHLLPHVAWIGLTILDRYQLLSEFSNVVHDAALTAISSGKYEMALEWLEQGRSIVWGQILHLRTPADELCAKEPELATQLLAVSQALDRASAREADLDSHLSVEQIVRNHHLLASQWDKLIQKVHLVPGFEGFLSPKTISQLKPAVHLGPIVIITIGGRGCSALILASTSDGVQHISLDGFSETEATEALNRLRSFQQTQRARSGSNKRSRITGGDPEAWFRRMLSQLWTKIVKPILDYLAISVAQTSPPPRIWWCPTGPLAFLPIHAAGDYTSDAPGSKIFDYVVSSYTPTVTALLDTPRSIQPSEFKFLAVSQASDLLNADTELDRIKQYVCSCRVEELRGQDATVERVIEGMSKASWVHLVCHGSQDVTDPTKSAFHLADDGCLELSQINKKGLPHAEFAYLSACHTAAGDVNVKEEAVHLAAGMLMAGYRGVIATMWAIRDEDGPQVANDVYAELFKYGQPDHTRAAYALHRATENLRRGGASFLSWVPFIHIGR